MKENMAAVGPGKLTDDAAERTFSAAAFSENKSQHFITSINLIYNKVILF